MKTTFSLLLVFLLSTLSSNGQRYLKQIFPTSTSSLNIQYGSNTNYKGNTEILELDFYEPSGDTLSKRPLIIYVHGGGFVDTNQSKSLLHIVAFADSMARRGYTVANVNYRLDTSISNRAVINAMHDAKAAVRFFRANAQQYKIDPDFIFIGGESAGAITSLTTTYINNLSEVSFPSTLPLSTDNSVEGSSGNPGFSSKIKATLCFCGGTKTIINEALFDTTAIDAGDSPILFVHGTNDQLIHVAQSLEIAKRVTNLGIPNLFYTLPGAGHCPWFFPLQNSWTYLDTLVNYTVPFLYACVQPNSITNNTSKGSRLKIYPNPCSDYVTLQIDELHSHTGELKILDIKGIIQEKKTVKIKNGKTIVQFSDFSDGLYYLVLVLEGREYRASLHILR